MVRFGHHLPRSSSAVDSRKVAQMPAPPRAMVFASGVAAGGVLFALMNALKKRREGAKKQILVVHTPKASPPAGHYSQATIFGDVLTISGLLPVLPDGTKLSEKPFEAQATQVLASLRAILEAAGSCPGKLISVRVYIADIENWGAFNALYAKFCGEHKPARAVVPVPHLHYGLALEIEAVAALS